MLKNIITDIPIGYSFFCLIFAVFVAVIVYYKQKSNSELSNKKIILLSAFRFLYVLSISVLLLNIVVKWTKYNNSKPIAVIGIDNSKSMSVESAATLESIVDNLEDKLEDKYNVLTYKFDNSIDKYSTPDYTGIETNIGNILNLKHSLLFNENIQLMVLLTDGINNSGIDPISISKQLEFPVYSVAMGDTTRFADIRIDKVSYNSEVYSGNSFPLFVNIVSNNFKGDTAVISVYKGRELLKTNKINISSNDFFTKVFFELDADEKETAIYDIEVKAIKGEKNVINNSKQISVNIRNDKKKVLYLYYSHHPDAAVFKQAIDKHNSYRWEFKNIKDFKSKPEEYALIILHQIPHKKSQYSNVLNPILKSDVPLLFVMGQNSNIDILNKFVSGKVVKQSRNLFDDVRPSINPKFSLFDFDYDAVAINEYPPINVVFGDYSSFPSSHVLFYQTTGNVKTNKPLVSFVETGDRKVGLIMGEGIWRWNLHDYKVNGNHTFINDFVLKTVQYLSYNEKKDRLIIENRNKFYSHEQVTFSAKLYNASYELTTEPELNLVLVNNKGEEYPYVFNKQQSYYQLNIGSLEEGIYNFTASVDMGDEKFSKKGTFVVNKSDLEDFTHVANHNLLYNIAHNTNGKVFYPNYETELLNELSNIKMLEAEPQKTTLYNDLLNNKWLFWFIILLITTEWFLRKIWGSI